jgi:glutathione S-transferase
MKLYGSYTSPFVRHCRIALLETELPCTFVETDHATSATGSPTKRVPYLHDDTVMLTDSASILKYLRNRAGQGFMEDVIEYDRFCLVNTVLDTTVNLFMLEKDGLTPEKSAYLKRQSQRIATTLEELDNLVLGPTAPYNDAELRLACYLDWALFRERIDLAPYQNLVKFLEGANNYEHFRVTAPPRA